MPANAVLPGSTSSFSSSKQSPKRKNRKHITTVFTERMCFLALFLRKLGFELFTVQNKGFYPLTSVLPQQQQPRTQSYRPWVSNAKHCDSKSQQPAGGRLPPCPWEQKPFRIDYFRDSSTATATDTVIPTMGLLPAPRKPIISTWAGTEEEPANWASECIRPMVSVMP